MGLSNKLTISFCLCLTPAFAQEGSLETQFRDAVKFHAEVWTQVSPITEEFEVGVDHPLVRFDGDNEKIFAVPHLSDVVDRDMVPVLDEMTEYLRLSNARGGANGQLLYDTLVLRAQTAGLTGGTVKLVTQPDPVLSATIRQRLTQDFPNLRSLTLVPHMVETANGSMLQYQLITRDNQINIVSVLPQPDFTIQYEVDIGRPYNSNIIPNSGTGFGLLSGAIPEEESLDGCDVQKDGILDSSCLRSAVAVINERDLSTLGSAVWLGGRFALGSAHVSENAGGPAMRLFFGYDKRDFWEGSAWTSPEMRDHSIAIKARIELSGDSDLHLYLLEHEPDWSTLDPIANAPLDAPLILADEHRATLSTARLIGAGYGMDHLTHARTWNTEAGNRRRKGTMRWVCNDETPNCLVETERAERMMVAHVPEPDTQEISYACVFDSGSPLFVQVEEQRLALVGILTQTSVTSGCADTPGQSEFIDLTDPVLQLEIQSRIQDLDVANSYVFENRAVIAAPLALQEFATLNDG